MANHSYGWRGPSLPDRRDKIFTAPPGILASLPPSVDLTAGMGPVLDQGSIGSCGPNSLCSMLMWNQQQQGQVQTYLSRLFLYYTTRDLMNTLESDSGVDNRTMLRAINRWGFTEETLWPYSDDKTTFRKQPPQNVYQAALPNKVLDYSSVAQTSVSMKGCLAAGDPFLFGFTLYESFESQAVSRTGIVPMPRQREQVLGGHDVVIVGYDDVSGRWKFKNSWSAKWGDKGYGYFPSEYVLSRDLSSDFWVVKTIPGGSPIPPTPTPVPPTPTPTGKVTISFPDGTIAEIPPGAWKAEAVP